MEAKDIIKWSILGFFILFLLTGLSLIIFAVTVPTPFGDYLTMKAAAFPVNYGLRIGLLILILFIAALFFFAIAKENNRLLTLVAILLIILFLVEFIMGIVYFTMKSEVKLNKKKFSNGQQMMAEYGQDKKVTEAMDRIQRTYACCGIVDYRDWFTSKWAAAQVRETNLCGVSSFNTSPNRIQFYGLIFSVSPSPLYTPISIYSVNALPSGGGSRPSGRGRF